MRRGLVLGCGGTLGMAWSLATLAELERAWDWDARTAEVIVGSSAGAELACLLGGGTPVADLLRAQQGDPLAPDWIADHLRADPGRFPPLPSPRIGSIGLAAKALRRRAPGLAGLTGALPIGGGDPAWLVRMAERMASAEGGWVEHPATWLVAADYDTAERVAFGSPGAPPASIVQGVLASWALPSWLPPVRIGGRRFVDGGVLSPASADLVAPLELDEVAVLAPMASSNPGRPVGVIARGERIVRRHMTRVLDAEIATVRDSGTRVYRFEPGERDLAAMGGNFMDARRRAATLASATESIRDALGSVGSDGSDGSGRGAARGGGRVSTDATGPVEVEVAILGGGICGIGAGITLKREGVHDFVILERADELGGTWLHNTYPGCAVDIPSHLYSFSFAMNPDWSRTFAGQPELRRYAAEVAERFGMPAHVRFGTEVLEARWLDEEQRWELQTTSGLVRARFFIVAAGPLHEPEIPDLAGLSSFRGEMFHSSRWRHDVDLRGRRVAVIGNGASALQFVPEIQPLVEQLTVFQRTPSWVMPRLDWRTSAFERSAMRRVPGLMRLMRWAQWLPLDLLILTLPHPRLARLSHPLGKWNIARAITDRSLRRKVTPDYTIGCKRVGMSNTYYPALTRPNVALVASAVTEVRADSLLAADGSEHAVDTIIFGTGFKVLTTHPVTGRIRGRGGVTLSASWDGSPRAYNGTTIAGFPNLFMMFGPNIGTASGFVMAEAQFDYIAGALRACRDAGLGSIEISEEAQRAFVAEMDAGTKGSVFLSGCSSYYLDRTGRVALAWPFTMAAMRRRLRRFDLAPYETRRPAPAYAPETRSPRPVQN